MDTNKRLLAKSVTWQMCGFVVMTLIGYLFTGSVTQGSGIAVSGMVIGFFNYFTHEALWARVAWGRKTLHHDV